MIAALLFAWVSLSSAAADCQTAVVSGAKVVGCLVKQPGRAGRIEIRSRNELLYFRTAAGGKIALGDRDGAPAWLDVFEDGSRVFVFRQSIPALKQSSLALIRVERGKALAIGNFPEAAFEDIDGDGRPELIERQSPLGRFFVIDCPNYSALASAAVKIEVLSPKNGKLEPASGRYPHFFETRAAEGEKALKSSKENPAARLGRAVTLYEDYAALGKASAGWERLSKLLDETARLPGARDCAEKVRQQLKDNLTQRTQPRSR